ncbi:MAG: extracellular solute-binding protein [Anaerolineae bacterium]|nr:extracellular solute-binding protein [Anaerolineae bacterium]
MSSQSHGLSRRRFIQLAGLSAAGLALAGRGSQLVTHAQDTSLTGKLTFWGHGSHPLDNIREAFLKKYPNVELDWQQIDDHAAKFKTAMAAGTGAPDLYWAEAYMVQQYGSVGALLETTDIVDKVKDKLIAGKLAEAWVPSKNGYFGMPGDLSVSGLYYREDLLKEMGIEISQDMMYEPDFLDILTKVAAAGKKAVLYPKGGTFVAAAQWSWFDNQYGGSGPATCDNESITLNDEAGLNAVKLIKKIYDTGSTLQADFWTPEYWNAINTGDLVIDLAPAWARGFWEANVDASVLGKWRLAPMPRAVAGGPRTAVWGGATLISPATTQNPDLAKIFMEFAFASMEGATAAGNWGIIPPYIPYLEGEFATMPTKLFGEQKIGQVWLDLAKELSTSFCRTAVYSAAVDEKLTPTMDSMITGGANIEETMQKITDEVNEILPDYQ